MAVTVRRDYHLRFVNEPSGQLFPTAANTGVPSGWTPTTTIDMATLGGSYDVDTPDTVVEDTRFLNGVILVKASNVTIRNCEIIDGCILNGYDSVLYGPLLVEDTTIRTSTYPSPAPSSALPAGTVIGYEDYTCRRCLLLGVNEGWHTGYSGASAGPVVVEDCYLDMIHASDQALPDYHGDGFQSVDDATSPQTTITVRNTVIHTEIDWATSAITVDLNNSDDVTIDRLLVSGAGAPFRIEGSGGTVDVNELYVVDDSWAFFPVGVNPESISAVQSWSAWTCTIDVNGQPVIVDEIPQPT